MSPSSCDSNLTWNKRLETCAEKPNVFTDTETRPNRRKKLINCALISIFRYFLKHGKNITNSFYYSLFLLSVFIIN